MSETNKTKNIFEIVKIARNQLDNEIKNLDSTLKSNIDSFTTEEKRAIENLKDRIISLSDEFNINLNQRITKHEESNVQTLNRLREALENELGSFGEYANNLIGNEETKLVDVSESSLINIKDLTTSHFKTLKSLTEQFSKIADDSVKSPIKMVKEFDLEIKNQLSDSLKFQKDELQGKITNLQEEYREKIGSQIERVFLGVTMTKEGINEIIKDTLSRLEENLVRLTEGLDKNFTSEVGLTQDLIHEYEGKMLTAIGDMQENYDEQVNEILTKHMDLTTISLNKMQSKLNEEKNKILSQIKDLSTEQQELVKGSVIQLEEQVSESKSSVIDFMGNLKDELQKALNENKDSTANFLKEIQKQNSQINSELMSQIKDDNKRSKDELKSALELRKKEVDEQSKETKKLIAEQINFTKSVIQEFDSKIKQEEKS